MSVLMQLSQGFLTLNLLSLESDDDSDTVPGGIFVSVVHVFSLQCIIFQYM